MNKCSRKLLAGFMALIMIGQQAVSVYAASSLSASAESGITAAAAGDNVRAVLTGPQPIAAYDFTTGSDKEKLADKSPRGLNLTLKPDEDQSDAWRLQQRSARASFTSEGLLISNGFMRLPDNLFSDLNVADISGMTISITMSKQDNPYTNHTWEEPIFSFSSRWQTSVLNNVSDRPDPAFHLNAGNAITGTGKYYYGGDGNWIDGGSFNWVETTDANYATTSDLKNNTFHNITLTYDVATNTVVHYVDGKLVRSSLTTNRVINTRLTAQDIKSFVANAIGFDATGGPGTNWWGLMTVKNFTAYSRALTAEQVKILNDKGWREVAKGFTERGSFTVAELKVNGLPKTIEGVWFSYADKSREGAGATAIGNKFREKGYDIIGVSEDCNFNTELANAIGTGYSQGTHEGGITSGSFNDIDGLNVFWKNSKVKLTKENRVNWTTQNGALRYNEKTPGIWPNQKKEKVEYWVDGYGDGAMINKGYRYYQAEIASGAFVDIYMFDMDKGDASGDVSARASQMAQLADAIKASKNKNPIIVMGDMTWSCGYISEGIEDKFIKAISADPRFTVSNCRMYSGSVNDRNEKENKIFLISNSDSHTTLRLNGYSIDNDFKDGSGAALSNNDSLYPVVATFGYSTHEDWNNDDYCDKTLDGVTSCPSCMHEVDIDGHCKKADCTHKPTAACGCGGNKNNHPDDNNDGYCDKKCHACLHVKNSAGTPAAGHCATKTDCAHDDCATCGGSKHIDKTGDGFCNVEGCVFGMHKQGPNGHCTIADCNHKYGTEGCNCNGSAHVDDGTGKCRIAKCGVCLHKKNPLTGHCEVKECTHGNCSTCGGKDHVNNGSDKCSICGKCLHPTQTGKHCTVTTCNHGSSCTNCNGIQCVDVKKKADGTTGADGWCDICGKCMHMADPTTKHCTADECHHGSDCDICGGKGHNDTSKDGFCNVCGECMHETVVGAHCKEAGCTHNNCKNCGGSVSVDEKHKDGASGSDGWCDICGKCLHKRDTDTKHCTDASCTHTNCSTCGGKVCVDNKNKAGQPIPDGWCDICGKCMHTGIPGKHCTATACVHDVNCKNCGGPVHGDTVNNGYCDRDNDCMHTKGSNGHCTAESCSHTNCPHCGGKNHIDNDTNGKCDKCGICLHTKKPGTNYCSMNICDHGSDCGCGGTAPNHSHEAGEDGFCRDANCNVCMHPMPAQGQHCTVDNCQHKNSNCQGCRGKACFDDENEKGQKISDGWCDVCGACMHDAAGNGKHCTKVDCTHTIKCDKCHGRQHADTTKDGWCNVCGICVHADKKGSDGHCTADICIHKGCPICGGKVCVDNKNKAGQETPDGWCDICGKCVHTTGESGHCEIPDCPHNTAEEECNTCHGSTHIESKGNVGYCAICGRCMHGDPGADDHCTVVSCTHRDECECGGREHIDNDGDGFCDKENCPKGLHVKGADGHCTDINCKHDPEANPGCACGGRKHKDTNNDDYCDVQGTKKCNACMHIPDADGIHCTLEECKHGLDCTCGGIHEADDNGFCKKESCALGLHTPGPDGHCTDPNCNHNPALSPGCKCGGKRHIDVKGRIVDGVEVGDGYCDIEQCGKCIHTKGSDGHCDAFECNHSYECDTCRGKKHIDAVGSNDGRCDICNACLHGLPGSDSHCTQAVCDHDVDCTCGSKIHPDENGDSFCDRENCKYSSHVKGDDGHCTDESCTHDPATNPDCTCGGRKHYDINGDGYCDACDICLHEKGDDGYCKTENCGHADCATCGGKKPAPEHTEHADKDKDGYCDTCNICLHKKGTDGYCTDKDCGHKADCACGGKKPASTGEPEPGTKPEQGHKRHADTNGDGYCDTCNICMHVKGTDGYCTDKDCGHADCAACGGKSPVVTKLPELEIEEDRRSVGANGTIKYRFKSNIPGNLREYLPKPLYLSLAEVSVQTDYFKAAPPVTEKSVMEKSVTAAPPKARSGGEGKLAICAELAESLTPDKDSVAVMIGDRKVEVEPEVAPIEENKTTLLRVELDLVKLYNEETITDDDIDNETAIIMTYVAKASSDIEPGTYANKAYIEYNGEKTEEKAVEVKSFGMNLKSGIQAAGKEFALFKSGKEVARVKSDENGNIIFKGLEEGNYFVKEVPASGVFVGNEPGIYVPVDGSQNYNSQLVEREFVNLTAPNPEQPGNTGNTGNNGNGTSSSPATGVESRESFFLIIGMICITAGMVFGYKKRETVNITKKG